MRLITLGLISVFLACAVAPERRVPQPPLSTVFEVAPVSGLGLFADERAQAQALIAAAFSDGGVVVANPEAITRAWAMASEGRDPITGAVCGMPLNSWSALRRWGPSLGLGGRINAQVTCPDGRCRLSTGAVTLEGHQVDRLTREAPLAQDAAALPALAEALTKLSTRSARAEQQASSTLSAFQRMDHLEILVVPADRRQKAGVDEKAFQSLAPESFLGCFDGGLTLLVETNPNGEVVRCEGEEEFPSDAVCACQQLKALRWGRGTARWEVTLRLSLRDQTSDDGRLVLRGSWNKSSELIADNSIRDWSPGSARLATSCFAKDLKGPGQVNSKWAVWFDELGQATKAIEQKGFEPLQSEVAHCVEEALKKAKAPCPSRKGLWAMADLQITAKSQNSLAPEGERVRVRGKP